jgi:Holliday junction DNA helicase RuvA
MIHHLSGRLTHKYPTHIVLECGGVGYHINISLHSYEKLPKDENLSIFTHLIVKEDSHTLFGFMEEAEREMFLLLLSISGVGANTARLLLSALNPSQVAQAIQSEDVTTFKKVKGIGEKSAKRIILELKDKVLDLIGSGQLNATQGNTVLNEALSGLLVLGFDKQKARKVVDAVYAEDNDISVENLIKQALKKLY